LSIGTLILIVLGIIILVLLILGFSMGWSNLWEKINIFGGGTSLEAVAEKCKLAQGDVGYCQTFVEVKEGGVKRQINCDYRKIRDGIEKPLVCNVNLVKEKCRELLLNKFKRTYDSKTKFNNNFEKDCRATGFIVNDEECNAEEYCSKSTDWLEYKEFESGKDNGELKIKR